MTRSPDDASKMLRRLDEEGSKAGLTINKTKTKVMRSAFSSQQLVLFQGVLHEDVSEYVYLGRLLNMENDIKPEIARRGRAGWAAYNSFKSDIKDQKLRAVLFNSTVLPALCYASETWALTKIAEIELRSTQTSIERRMLWQALRQQKERHLHNSDVKALSKVHDVVLHADESKHRHAGHLMKCKDGPWSSAALRWSPRDKKKRPRGRPPLRWYDSLAHRNNSCASASVKVHWSTKAQDRTMWKRRWDPRKANRRAEERVT
ncbi:hypothetical protein Y032_0942g3146 [Ancylostoma ceylanicum]|uniref:Reverse transcriptase domain-containing protein n=1 Tax=Ancylostoma ceylanicum TaxID=53326 RepID=A0A016W8X0_9BILA|nr:hypothetical protein Y032_0942g3146 [Ancylostoma ceylanicum]